MGVSGTGLASIEPEPATKGSRVGHCAFHPGVETSLRCGECERYICPKDMVATPVGYKCRECAKPAAGQLKVVKPRQFAYAAAAGLAAAVVGGLVLGQLRFGGFLLSILFGVLVGEATRRGSGGHRVPVVAGIAGVAALVGVIVGGLGPLTFVLAVVAAVLTVLANGL